MNSGNMTEQVDEGCNQGGDGSSGHPVTVTSRQDLDQEANLQEEQAMISGSANM